MKKLATIIGMFVTINFTFSQNLEECEKIVMKTYDAINKGNSDQLVEHLADDFSIAGHSGELAKLILPQLINQLNEKVSDIKKISETKTEYLTLVYEAKFSEMGVKSSTFVFNKKNELKELELVKIEVKTMKPGTAVVRSKQETISVPFKQVNNLITVEAKLNGVTKTFLLDNGAPKLILNNAHSENDTLEKRINVGNAKGVGGAIPGMDIVHLDSFNFYGIQLLDQEVIAVDLSSLEDELNMELYGLIGYEVFKDYDILFDYKNSSLTFVQPEKTKEFLLKNYNPSKIVEVPITMEKHLATVECVVQKKKFVVGIDCGAESNLFDLSLAEELSNELQNTRKDTLSGADGNIRIVEAGKLKSLKVGSMKFKKTETVFSDISHLNMKSTVKINGLIGFEILSRQPSLISYKNKKLYFLQ